MKNKTLLLTIIISFMSIFYSATAEELTDQAGFKFKKPEKVERLVIVFPQSFGLAYILGLGKNIVGMPLRRIGLQKQSDSIFMRTVAPNMDKAVDVGNPGQPNTETILGLKPDLVFSAIHVPASQKLNELLRNANIPVLGLKAGFGGIEDWLSAVELAGKASCREEQAQKYINLFRKNMELVKSKTQNITQKPKVLLINNGDGQTTIRGNRTKFVFELIEAAGGQTIDQIEGSESGAVNLEVILKFDPDVVITDNKSHMQNWEWWPQLRAVKENRVYIVPIDDPSVIMTSWVNNMYAPLAVLWIAKSVHPELFKDLDLDKEHDKFCEEIFGIKAN
ncbi:MAG: ABC transporter substrate-binding protein [Candidatus Riflebacteria bacterium]|nr:ABC transporter substrate-binding protein [Candidatus Riflebacteria bacterium]